MRPDVLRQIRGGKTVSVPTVIVTAHADDETLGMGGTLGLFQHACLVQLTDCGRARHLERHAACAAAAWTMPVIDCEAPDHGVHLHGAAILSRIQTFLADAEAVFTHPYEGGHPDHDSAAFLVQTACERLGAAAPMRYEFASYHFDGQRRAAGDFYPRGQSDITRVPITGDRLEAKRRALACYGSQASIVRWFNPALECYRPAPTYRFDRGPQVPACLYERKGWPLSNAAWLATIKQVAA